MKYEVWFEPNGSGHCARWHEIEAVDPAEALKKSPWFNNRRPQDNMYCVSRQVKTFACIPSSLEYGRVLRSLGYQQIST